MRGIYTLCNQKGGVGKTSITVTLSIALANRGFKTLVIDLDSQCNLTNFFEKAPIKHTIKKSVYNVLCSFDKVSQNLEKINDNLWLLGSDKELATLETQLNAIGREYRLRDALKPIINDFDYILIDTPPALGSLTINALVASSDVIIITPLELFGLYGLKDMAETVGSVRKYCNANIKINGVLINRFIKRAVLNRSIDRVLKSMAETIGVRLYQTKIRECSKLKEAITAKKSIFDYDSNSISAIDFTVFLKEFFNE